MILISYIRYGQKKIILVVYGETLERQIFVIFGEKYMRFYSKSVEAQIIDRNKNVIEGKIESNKLLMVVCFFWK